MVCRGHIPRRICTGCGARRDRSQLVRFRSGDQGRLLVLDAGGKAPGRGAYTCSSLECFDRALKKRSLSRRLGGAEALPQLRDEFIRFLEKAQNNGKKKSLRDSQRA